MKLTFACCLCLAATGVFGQVIPHKSDAEEENLRGKVKSVVEIVYDDKQPGVTPLPASILEKKETKFNRQGNISESTLSSKILTNQGETFLRKVFQYDSLGQVISCSNTREYGLTTTDSFICDGQGNIMVQVSYGAGHAVISKVVRLYDEKGRELLKSDYDVHGPDNILTSETATTYFDVEHQRETKTRKVKGSFEDVLTSLDEKGRPARAQLLDTAKNTLKEWDWTFDKFDNMTNVEEWTATKLMGATRYTYEYDKTGNWTKRSEYKGTNTTRVTSRVVEYY